MRAQRLAAIAADKPVDAAQNVEKPYVFLETPHFDTWEPAQPLLPGLNEAFAGYSSSVVRNQMRSLRFFLRNRGNGIAIMEELHIKQCITKGTSGSARSRTTMMRNERLVIRQRVIGPAELPEHGTVVPIPVSPPSTGFFNDPKYAFVGFIQYRDVFDRRYKSHFCYTYDPPFFVSPPDAQGFFLVSDGPEKFYSRGVRRRRRNRIDEEK